MHSDRVSIQTHENSAILNLNPSSMSRNIVKSAYITNDAARKATYKRRNKVLVMKVSELSTLYDTEACVVIYSPNCESQPEVSPSAVADHHILSDFKALSIVKRSNGTMSQEIARGESQKGVDSGHVYQNKDLNDLSCLIDQNLNNIDNRLHMLIKVYDVREK